MFLAGMGEEVIAHFSRAVMDAPAEASAVWNDFHGAVTRVPLDATAFPLRRRGFDLFISVPWHTPEQRTAAIAWSSGLADALRPSAAGVYVNNLNETESDRVREAYGPHYDRLAAIKARYDPANLLRINHNVAPVGGW